MGEVIFAVPIMIKGLIKVIREVRKTLIRFKAQLENLEWSLLALKPAIEEVKKFEEETADESCDERREEMRQLQKNLDECEQLVNKCRKVSRYNIPLVKSYTQRLKRHSDYLHKFATAKMQADIWVAVRKRRTASSMPGSALPKPPALTVGWAAPVAELKRKLFQEDISVLGISGLAGCGKTALALKFCEQVKDEFYKISYLSISEKPDLVEMVYRLWRDLVSNVGELPNFKNVDDGMNHLKSRLENRKPKGMVLVVLDGVWSDTEVEKLVVREPGFKTLVTTRMDLNWIQYNHQVQQLGMEEAKDLFFHCLPAGQQHRSKLNHKLVEQIVEACVRHPLALEVIGASLKNTEDWELRETVERIAGQRGQILDRYVQILRCLETSVEFLTEKQRECFMDFCCFPANKRIRAAAVMDMWVQIRGETELGARRILQDLFDRHLIERIDRRRNHGGDADEGFGDLFVTLHGLLKKLAVQNSRKTKTRLVISESDELPNGDLTKEAQIVSLDMGDGRRNLDTYTPNFPNAEVLILNFSNSCCFLPPFLKGMKQLKLLIVANHSATAAELNLRELPRSSFSIFGAAKRYPKNLRSLRLEKIALPIHHTFKEPFPGLQKLSMVLCKVGEEESFSSFDIPKIFPDMTEIEIDYCDGLERLPTSVCRIHNLKKLRITNCHDLMELPDAIGSFTKLEVLSLRSCAAIERLPDSISGLEKLKFLSLSGCSNISNLPETIGSLQGLERIDVRGCSAELPESVLQLKGLLHVKCDPDNVRKWKPFLDHINPKALDVHKLEVNLDFLN